MSPVPLDINCSSNTCNRLKEPINEHHDYAWTIHCLPDLYGAGILMVASFVLIYLHMTPVKEPRLIKEGCVAAALSFGGALAGFCLTLASSITHADNFLTFIIWGVCSAVVQLLVYFVISHLVPNASMKLEDNNIAVGTLFCCVSLSIGILNAACLG